MRRLQARPTRIPGWAVQWPPEPRRRAPPFAADPLNFNPPRVDVRAGVPTATGTGTRPTVNVNTGTTRPTTNTGASGSSSASGPAGPGRPMTVNTYTITGADGTPTTLTTRTANGADLSASGRANQLSIENDRYTSGSFQLSTLGRTRLGMTEIGRLGRRTVPATQSRICMASKMQTWARTDSMTPS